MVITIRDKHTGQEKEYGELFELLTDAVNFNLTIVYKDGWKRPYILSKKDYEISYIG